MFPQLTGSNTQKQWPLQHGQQTTTTNVPIGRRHHITQSKTQPKPRTPAQYTTNKTQQRTTQRHRQTSPRITQTQHDILPQAHTKERSQVHIQCRQQQSNSHDTARCHDRRPWSMQQSFRLIKYQAPTVHTMSNRQNSTNRHSRQQSQQHTSRLQHSRRTQPTTRLIQHIRNTHRNQPISHQA